MQNVYDPIKVDDDYFPYHEEEQEDFYSKLGSLPRNIADILLVPETTEALEKVSKEKNLNISQSREISRLVRKITIADIYLGDVVKELQSRLGIDESLAKELASSLISEIFSPALEDIKKMHVEKFGSSSREAVKSETNTVDLRK